MRGILLAVLLTLQGCASLGPDTSLAQAHGVPLLTIRITEGAFHGRPARDAGWFFYLEDSGSITGYEAKDGQVVDIVGGGTYQSEILLRKLRAIGFQQFDYTAEIARVYKAEKEKTDKEGMSFLPPITLDGAEYEISYNLDGTHFQLRAWNPGADIDYCAGSSPQVAKLKSLLELFFEFCGRSKIGI